MEQRRAASHGKKDEAGVDMGTFDAIDAALGSVVSTAMPPSRPVIRVIGVQRGRPASAQDGAS